MDRENEEIEISICRMNLLDMRGLPARKAEENNGDTKEVSTGAPPQFYKWHGCIPSDADFIHILGFS